MFGPGVITSGGTVRLVLCKCKVLSRAVLQGTTEYESLLLQISGPHGAQYCGYDGTLRSTKILERLALSKTRTSCMLLNISFVFLNIDFPFPNIGVVLLNVSSALLIVDYVFSEHLPYNSEYHSCSFECRFCASAANLFAFCSRFRVAGSGMGTKSLGIVRVNSNSNFVSAARGGG